MLRFLVLIINTSTANSAAGMEVFAEGSGRDGEMASWIITLRLLLFQLPETAGYLWLDVDKRNVDA